MEKQTKLTPFEKLCKLKNAPQNDEKQNFIKNVDLKSHALINAIDILCNFTSTQYVFDSHFGTWSQWKDINMMRGIEHDNDFYFIVPNDISFDKDDQSGYISTWCSLCRLNQDKLGDDDINNSGKQKAIAVSYKTVDTFDFQIPVKKLFKRIKVFGTTPTFWQPKQSEDEPFPFAITPFSDFKAGQKVSFIHAFDHDSLSQKVLKKNFAGRNFKYLSKYEMKNFFEIYKGEADMISQVSLPIIAMPGTRFGIMLEMNILEAYVQIFGFEIIFEPTQQIL